MQNKFMKAAIKEAQKAAVKDEVPIGAVIVYDGKIIARGHNTRQKTQNAINHAEMIAIQKACKKVGSWRLIDCDIYVTLEPCPMCAGAIINSRIERVVYGAPDHKAGAFGTMINLTDYPLFKPQITSGILSNECSGILSSFFKNKR